jgi:gamma-glutamylcyclotransferase (GGCT)/AIG2-like uncharacterized protein YtfP
LLLDYVPAHLWGIGRDTNKNQKELQIISNASMKLIACYGSLKKGYYNNSALGADAEFKGEHAVKGVMYSNGSYPKLYRTDEDQTFESFNQGKERDHVLEVYEINDNAYRRIEPMEVGAGYVTEQIETPYGMAAIWYMPHANFSSHDKWVASY